MSTENVESKEPPKEKKAPPPGLVIPPKKPKLSKAERRALQEQQRAAKANKQQQPGSSGNRKDVEAGKDGTENSKRSDSTTTKTNDKMAVGGTSNTARQAVTSSASTRVDDQKKRLAMVSHLTPFTPVEDIFVPGATLKAHEKKTTSAVTSTTATLGGLHPTVVQLGYRYAAGEIRGGNARCRAMLATWQQVLRDFEPPSTPQDLRPVVDGLFRASFQFWTETCRPHSVSMGNAYSMLKTATAALDRQTTWEDMRDVLIETMQAYTHERIDIAGQAIAELACRKLLPDNSQTTRGSTSGTTRRPRAKVNDTTTILVYGYSEVVSLVLRKAAAAAATAPDHHFSVICVDSRPLLEGRRMLDELRAAGVKDCTYVLLNALTYVLPHVNTVLLGAAALMSDGAVWNRVGTANVALLANAQRIPVLVCAETYKIANRVQLEALTHNELGEPPANPQEDGTEDDKIKKNLAPINLLYDLTPASFVSGIVTELGIVPPTSVAVLLRELNSNQQG
jgi:translation initiation factor eIF-2B subunit delta